MPLKFMVIPPEIKNPWQISLPRTNKVLIRGTTLIHGKAVPFVGYYHIPDN